MTLNSSHRARSSKLFRFFGTLLHQRPREVSAAERSVRDLRHMPRFHEPLQYDHDEESIREEQRQSSQLSSSSTISEGDECTEALGKSSRKRRVTFEESVVVVPVPLRSDYSERMQTKLWSNAVERCDSYERNLIEFEAENRDWRCACLEDEMYTCSDTQELIHPAHVETMQYTVSGSLTDFRQIST